MLPCFFDGDLDVPDLGDIGDLAPLGDFADISGADISSSTADKRGRMFLAVVVLLLGIVGTVWAGRDYLLRRAQLQWPIAQANALATRRSAQGVWMKLEFSLEGKIFRGEATLVPTAAKPFSPSQEQGFVVQVHFNPENPSQLTFHPGPRKKERRYLLMAGAVLLLGTLLVALAWPTSHRCPRARTTVPDAEPPPYVPRPSKSPRAGKR